MNSDHVLRDALSKVPPATLAFRIVKSFAATVGKSVAALDSRVA